MVVQNVVNMITGKRKEAVKRMALKFDPIFKNLDDTKKDIEFEANLKSPEGSELMEMINYMFDEYDKLMLKEE